MSSAQRVGRTSLLGTLISKHLRVLGLVLLLLLLPVSTSGTRRKSRTKRQSVGCCSMPSPERSKRDTAKQTPKRRDDAAVRQQRILRSRD